MTSLIRLGVVLLIFGLLACKTAKPDRPTESYEQLFEQGVSVINIPVQLSLRELENMLNRQLDTVLYEDNDINDGDDMMVRAEKKERITLQLDSNQISYRVPLDIWVKYDAGIGRVEGTGALAIEFITDYQVKPDWNLETVTQIKAHEWIERPRLKLGIVNLPVGMIADMLINNFKTTITENIDQQIAQNLGLDKIMQEAWKNMHSPMLLSEEYRAWLLMHPQKISMTPLDIQDKQVSTTILIESQPEIRFGETPVVDNIAPLPAFAFASSASDDFLVRISSEISYTEAERLAQETVAGERYDYGKRYVIVDDLELYGQGNKLVVKTNISGTYTGEIYLVGRPVFNPKRNTIDVKDLKYTVDTRNFLLRSAGWLLKSKFKNTLQANLDFLLDANLQDIEKEIRQQLSNYEITENLVLNGQLAELSIANAYLAPEGIRVDVGLQGKLRVRMKKLTKP